jgi:hypothetical protein
MIARFDPDGLVWIVVTLFRVLGSVLRLGATAVGTVVIALVVCGLVYTAVLALRRYLTDKHTTQDYANAKRDMPSGTTSNTET